MNDLDKSTIIVEQNTIRMTCKIDIKRIEIFFSNAFYVSKCSLNLINFDQLNDFCSMTYKSRMFFVENQNIITKKRVNNVFFLELWKHVNYNFVITFIVNNLVEQVLIIALEIIIFELVDRQSSVNKTTLNIWHTRLKHLKKQNVRRLTKMFENMNLFKFIVDKDFWVSCIIIK
jgi:hypothetical protein